jgi:hypothetical protein
VKDAFAKLIEGFISVITQWDESSGIDDVKKAANSLKLYASVLNFIADNRVLLSRWAFAIAIGISIPFYCYISFLFSCVYYGIGKLQGITFPWPRALLDSLYIPFAWTDLPDSFPIRLIAGLHAIVIGFLGWNLFARHLGERLEHITVAASQLRGPLQDEAVKVRLSKIGEILSPNNMPPASDSMALLAQKQNEAAKE